MATDTEITMSERYWRLKDTEKTRISQNSAEYLAHQLAYELGTSNSDVVKHIIEIHHKSPPFESIGGYHGTGLETVIYCLKNRFLPGTTGDTFGTVEKLGDFYIAAEPKNLPQFQWRKDLEIDSLDTAGSYADNHAPILYFVNTLGLDVNKDEDLIRAADIIELGDPTDIEDEYDQTVDIHEAKLAFKKYQNELGFSRYFLNEVIARAKRRKGVVFYLDKKILDFYPLEEQDPTGEIKINCHPGLMYTFLNGLKTLGPNEETFMTELERSFKK